MVETIEIIRLFKDGKIDLKTALNNADSRSNLEWKINFGGGTKELESSKEEDSMHLSTPSDDLPEVN